MENFTVKILNGRGSAYQVMGDTPEQVWNAEKCWFSFGAEVEITAPNGIGRIFMK